MSMSVSGLARDSLNFFRNQAMSVVIISLLTAVVAVGLNALMTLNSDGLSVLNTLQNAMGNGGPQELQTAINNLSGDDKMQLLRTLLGTIFSSLLANAIFVSALLYLLVSSSEGQFPGALQAVTGAAGRIPRMLVLLLICSMVIALGLVAMYLPGIILSMLLALAPVILYTEKNSIFTAIKISGNIALKNFRLLLPPVVFWFALKYGLTVMLSSLPLPSESALMIIILLVNNIVSGLMLIYLFRFYQLFTQHNKINEYQ